MPPQIVETVNSVASFPLAGTESQLFPAVGLTTVTWGRSIGAYLLILAAVLRIVGGALMFSARTPADMSMQSQASQQPYAQQVFQTPPPPPLKQSTESVPTADMS
jgi:hypothetical protein